MKISTVVPIFFSPTGTSKKVVTALSSGFEGAEIKDAIDLTYAAPAQPLKLKQDDLTLFALPVYAGRLPALAVERLKAIDGNNSLAVVTVVYGNREYEDALIELCDLARSMSFRVIAACTFIGEHSFSSTDLPIAPGRPDNQDLSMAESFGKKIRQHLLEKGSDSLASPEVPGDSPYKDAMPSLPFTPEVDDTTCTGCGICLSTCPAEAISLKDDIAAMDVAACIFCCACIKNCPESAVKIAAPPLVEKAVWLHENCATRKEPLIFLQKRDNYSL